MRTAPPLAVEYSDTGQDEAQLQQKIREMLEAGTQIFWVVRLNGTVHVEVHTRGEPARIVGIDDELSAPGILKNPVPVRALVDAGAANAATLRNLLNAEGYESLDEVRAEGESRGERRGLREGERQAQIRGIVAVLQTRGFSVSERHMARLQACQDPSQLGRWLIQSVTATSADAALE
jgi:hypothetical protein